MWGPGEVRELERTFTEMREVAYDQMGDGY